MRTCESKPIRRIKGDKVISGSINGNGAIKFIVSHGAKDSYLSQVIKLVQDAQNSKSKTQNESVGGFAIERMVTVIVTCCLHALELAVPLVVTKPCPIHK
jgi:Cu2+-exporting ATPase